MRLIQHGSLRFIYFIAVVLLAVPLSAQELAGGIEGVVRDNAGAVLPGATVEAMGPAIGRVTTTTDSKGTYRFPRLPSGVYTVRASLTGFKTAEARNAEVVLGKVLTVNLTLGLGAVAEEITVTAEAPLVDVTKSFSGVSITREQIDRIPAGRDFTSVAIQAPGTANEPFLAGISVDGASGAENRFVIDGVDTTHPYNGRAGQQLITDFVEEIQVKSAGYAAEYGGSVGGVVNVVTKSGTNDIHGSLLGYFSDSSWNGDRRPTFYESDPTLYRTFPKDDETEFAPGGMVGGPIMRDQMWFFLGYNPRMTSVSRTPVGSSTTFDRDETIQYFTANIKGNVGSKVLYKIGGSVTNEEYENNLPAEDNTTPATADLTVTTKIPTSSYSAYGDYIPSGNFYLSGRVGYYTYDVETEGVDATTRITFTRSPPVPTDDPRYRPSGFASLPLASFSETSTDKWERQAGGIDGNLFVTALGHHSFKAGVQYEKIDNVVSQGENGNLYRFRWGLASLFGLGVKGTYGSVGIRRFRTEGGADSNNMGLYIQDSWTVIPNLTLNIGVRTEQEYVPNYGAKVDPTLPEWAMQWDFGDKIAPRLGFAWDVMSNQMLKVYGSYGTYFDIMKIDMARQSFGAARWIDYWYPLETLDWASIPAQCEISQNVQSVNICPSLGPNVSINLRRPTDPREAIDPDLEPMEQREYQLGVDYQLTPQSVVAIRYVNKKLINTIEDIGYLVEDAPGVFNEYYITGNPGKGLVAGDPPGPVPAQPTAKRDYEAVELSYNRLFRGNWSARANYTYSELRGNYSGLASSDEFGRNDPNIERYFDALHNAYDQNGRETVGPLNTDRPHAVKAQVLYRAPWGTSIGVNTSWRSGTPISEEVQYTSVPFFPHGRGNLGRTDDLTQTDLLLAHGFQLGNYSIEGSINVLNLFDEDAVTRVGNNHYRGDLCDAIDCNQATYLDDFFSRVPFDTDALMAGEDVDPSYRKPIRFQGPRSVRLAVKFTF